MRYMLNSDNEAYPCFEDSFEDRMTWVRWVTDGRNVQTAHTKVPCTDGDGDISISTVFLGRDHGGAWDGNVENEYLPVLWETMVFGGKHDGECRRYCSHASALAGHALMVELVQEGEREQEEAAHAAFYGYKGW